MRRKLHYFSDCPIFGGCENMLANFLSSKPLAEHFDVSFSYSHSPQYEAGLRKRVTNTKNIYPLQLYCVERLARKFTYQPARIIFRILAFVILLRYWFIAINIYKLWSFFGKIGPLDILHINNGGFPAAYSTYSAVYAARLRGVSKIVYVVNNIAASYSMTRWFDWPFDRIVVRNVDRFITGSQYAGVILKETLSLPDSKHVSIHNGIKQRLITESSDQTRVRLGMDSDNVILGVVALMGTRKGHIIAIKAMELIADRKTESLPTLLVEGSGGIEDELRDYVRE